MLQFVVVLGCFEYFDFVIGQFGQIWCDVFGQVYIEMLGGDCMVIFYVGVVYCYFWQVCLFGQQFGYMYGVGVMFVDVQ